jgi:hypothetical protein
MHCLLKLYCEFWRNLYKAKRNTRADKHSAVDHQLRTSAKEIINKICSFVTVLRKQAFAQMVGFKVLTAVIIKNSIF